MVFNIMANNTDDHERNFTFIREKDGPWKLSPAYDMNFIFNKNGWTGNKEHCLSIRGKTSDFNRDDLLDFAKENNIRNAENIIRQMASALMSFRTIADKHKVKPHWIGRLDDTIRTHLRNFHELAYDNKFSYVDQDANVVRDAQVLPMDNGAYQLRAMVNGILMRKFIPLSDPINKTLSENGITRITEKEMKDIMTRKLTGLVEKNTAVKEAGELFAKLTCWAERYVRTGQGMPWVRDLFNETYKHIVDNNTFSEIPEEELLQITKNDLMMRMKGILNESEREELNEVIDNNCLENSKKKGMKL